MTNVGLVRLDEPRCAAMALAGHGWPVLRGTYFDGVCWRGRAGAMGLQPVNEVTAWTMNATQAGDCWSDEPFSVLVACGYGVDCLELPGSIGPRVLGALRAAGIHPPAMLSPVGRLVLFVATDPGPRRTLVSASLRSTGSWVAVPPTGQRCRGLRCRWVSGSAPSELGWTLPGLGEAYQVIAAAVSGMASAPGMARKGHFD